MKRRFYSILFTILVSTLSLCTLCSCDSIPEQREKNLQKYQFEGLSWKDFSRQELLVPPGKRVMTFSVDTSEGSTKMTYILRPLSEGEQPKTYDVYQQSFSEPQILNTFKIVEQAIPSSR
ncbi:MAG: hypothetical protein NTX72_05570 [Candidatus Uhrbacteria bacterium]|nr:hypothetical protein [Candidatus Uhrbacteria bacterium]